MPYLVYMPERKRLMLAASVDKPVIKAIAVFSDDFGKTWTKPKWMHTDAAGNPDLGAATQLTYLREGKVLLGLETRYWASTDYGETWSDYAPVPVGSDGNVVYQWDPMLVDKDPKTGNLVRLVETRYAGNGTFDTAAYFSQGIIRFSTDEGKTWDLDHKYILASNHSPMTGNRENWGSPQSTSNVLLPDGSLLTTFGTGVRNLPAQTIWKMDVALVKWRLGSKPVNAEDTLRKAPYQSDLRNKFDLDSVK